MSDTLGPITSDFKKDTVRFAGKTNSGHSSRQVDSVDRGSQVAHQLNSCSHSVSSHNFDLVRDLSSCHRAPASESLVVVVVHVGPALCCSRCGLGLVGGNSSTFGECLLLAHGNDPWNSCVRHGEGQDAEHVHEVAGGTKPKLGSVFGNHSKVRYQLGTN